MAIKKLGCFILGHRWKRERRSDRSVFQTCQRCGRIDEIFDETFDYRGRLG